MGRVEVGKGEHGLGLMHLSSVVCTDVKADDLASAASGTAKGKELGGMGEG